MQLWLLVLVLGLLLDRPLRAQLRNYDGRDVTKMLARLGLGPGALKCAGEDATTSEDCSRLSLEDDLPEDMCWGYEKECTKERRLFVPQCGGSPSPW